MYGGVPVSFISDKERDALYPRLAAHAASKAAAVAAFRPSRASCSTRDAALLLPPARQSSPAV